MEKKIRTPIAATALLFSVAISAWTIVDNIVKYSFRYSTLVYVELAALLVLSFVLFAKKRNNILVIALGLVGIIKAVYLIQFISLGNFFSVSVHAILVALAITYCKQESSNESSAKIGEAMDKLRFVPAAVAAIGCILSFIDNIKYISVSIESMMDYYYFVPLSMKIPFIVAGLRNVVGNLLYFVAVLSLGMWLKDPYAKTVAAGGGANEGSYCAEEYSEAYCGLGKHILLCLFTCGIWYLIWTYRTTKFLNNAPNAGQHNPASKLLLCMFVPFYQIYWFYKQGQRMDAMAKYKKLNNSDMAILCLILGIFIPIVACILMQDRINTICTAKPVVEERKADNSVADELVSYKELLDSGVISQEEFDAKKKQLLGL